MIATRRNFSGAVYAAAAIFSVLACADEPAAPATGPSSLQVMLSNSPQATLVSGFVSEATVWVSKVYLEGVEDETPRVYLLNLSGTSREIDLLDLTTSPVPLTPLVDIDPGDYDQLKVVVDSATVTLASGFKFEDGSIRRRFLVPASMTDGVGVALKVKIDADAGRTTNLTIECDVNRSIKVSGVVGSAAGTHSITFEPWMFEKAREILTRR